MASSGSAGDLLEFYVWASPPWLPSLALNAPRKVLPRCAEETSHWQLWCGFQDDKPRHSVPRVLSPRDIPGPRPNTFSRCPQPCRGGSSLLGTLVTKVDCLGPHQGQSAHSRVDSWSFGTGVREAGVLWRTRPQSYLGRSARGRTIKE